MDNLVNKLISLIRKVPEDRLERIIKLVEAIIKERKPTEFPDCPNCGASTGNVVKYGSNGDKQRYRCNKCRKYFSATTRSAVESSRFGEAVWKQVIRDTINGVSLDKTAEALKVTHTTVFNMRHKILSVLETKETIDPTVLSGVCEVDDTYVLESVKGTKIPDG